MPILNLPEHMFHALNIYVRVALDTLIIAPAADRHRSGYCRNPRWYRQGAEGRRLIGGRRADVARRRRNPTRGEILPRLGESW